MLHIIIIIIIVCQWGAQERKLTHNYPMSQKVQRKAKTVGGGEERLELASFSRSQHQMLNIIINRVANWGEAGNYVSASFRSRPLS